MDEIPRRPRFDFTAVVLFGVSVFLAAFTLKILLVHIVGSFVTMGLTNTVYEFSLAHFALFSTLPLGFNLAFGAYFGLVLRRNAAGRSRSRRWAPSRGAAGLLVWCAVFNLPVLLGGDRSPEGLFPSWPPRSMYMPVRNELLLFHLMGNLALLTGFCATVSWARMRRMVDVQRKTRAA